MGLREEKPSKAICSNEALAAGGVAALKASAFSGTLFFLANRYSGFFRNQFSASAKTALLVMPIFYTSWLNVELAMHECMKKANMPDYANQQDDDDA